MNTPSHAILNLALLSQQQSIPALTITIGAILPDAPIFLLYFWAKLVHRQTERQIWSETYELPFWQNLVATFHSIPLALLGVATAHFFGWEPLQILSLSMVLHSLLDFPVHNHDAHRHFFPLSNYRFISPLSYWDTKHHARVVSMVEKLLVLAASIYVFPVIDSWTGRGLIMAVNLFYLTIYLYFRVIKPRLTPKQKTT
ncbi:MAG TPA: hypothetical protein DDZ80_01205 [Cyanobacteria bacterium UBA8803]|nr:hypothetical protein [Cyanobacteria bacterium UBA9273]HBL57223.1 hypothetical protein [Cyanobacteria bacterium UBA8803]